MNSIKELAQFVGLGLATMGLVACGGGGSIEGSGTEDSRTVTGLMSLAVTDAPIDGAEKVVIRFTHVELQPVDEDERVVICLGGDAASPLGEEESCPTTGVLEIDLLAYQGEDSAVLFEEVELPAGDYDWIRFYLEPDPGPSSPPLSNFLTSSYIVFKDETEASKAQLIIPGGLQAGLQLVSGFTVPGDDGGSGLVSFTVDFDLRNMIQPADEFEGNYYRMARALRLVENSTAGAITGTVDVGSYPELSEVAAACSQDGERCAGLSVSVYTAGPVEGGTDTDGDTVVVAVSSGEEPLTTANVFAKYLEGQWEYRYTVGFLSEGSYDLKLVLEGLPGPLDQAKGVSVVAGEKKVENLSSID